MTEPLPEPQSDSAYAGVDRRLGAIFVDIVLLFAVLAGFQFLLSVISDGFPFNQLTTGGAIEIWILLAFSLPAWLYFSFSESSRRQATLGKGLFKVQVTDLDGKRIGFWRAFLRTLIKLLPWELIHLSILVPTPMFTDPTAGLRPGIILVYLLLIVYMLLMIFTPRKRSLHDLVVGTMVLDRRITEADQPVEGASGGV